MAGENIIHYQDLFENKKILIEGLVKLVTKRENEGFVSIELDDWTGKRTLEFPFEGGLNLIPLQLELHGKKIRYEHILTYHGIGNDRPHNKYLLTILTGQLGGQIYTEEIFDRPGLLT